MSQKPISNERINMEVKIVSNNRFRKKTIGLNLESFSFNHLFDEHLSTISLLMLLFIFIHTITYLFTFDI